MTFQFKRVIILVLDSVGAGALPDASSFGDEGADTLGHLRERVGLKLPNLCKLGLGEITSLEKDSPRGSYGKMAERSAGKDTTSGHWEIAGVSVETPFQTYPQGFPKEVLDPFSKATGREIVCNAPASGTEVIQEFGEHHQKTGDLIVYTSADSVFQIAAHEEVVPLEELYRICQTARDILRGEHQVARVIARPFLGGPGQYARTANRKDFSVEPPKATLLDKLVEKGIPVIGVGKIGDIYAHRGITYSIKTKDNDQGVDRTLEALDCLEVPGLIFTNLVDFDMLYGHRRDPEGYKKALEEFDGRLPEILDRLKPRDLLFITADHGNDPTHPGTDHTREYVPLLAYHREMVPKDIGLRKTFADLGHTIGANFQISLEEGESFLSML